MKEYGINVIGEGAQIFEPVTIGFPSRENIGKTGFIRDRLSDIMQYSGRALSSIAMSSSVTIFRVAIIP